MYEANFYLLLNNEEKGPLALDKIGEMLAGGEITYQTLYAQPGMAEWLALEDIREQLEAVVPPVSTKPAQEVETVEISVSSHEELWAQAIEDVFREAGDDITVEVVRDENSGASPEGPRGKPDSTKTADDGFSLTRLELECLSRFPRSSVREIGGHFLINEVSEEVTSLYERGFLVEAPIHAKINSKFRVVDLKPVLRNFGLRVSGRKASLIANLVENAPTSEVEALVADIGMFELTDQGREHVEAYQAMRAEETARMESEASAALRAGDVVKAGKIVGEYGAKQAYPRSIDNLDVEGAKYLNGDIYRDLPFDADIRREVGVALALSFLLVEGVLDAAKRVFKATGETFACPDLEVYLREHPEGGTPDTSENFNEDPEEGSMEEVEDEAPDAWSLAVDYSGYKLAAAHAHRSLVSIKQRDSYMDLGVEIVRCEGPNFCIHKKTHFEWSEIEKHGPLIPCNWGCECYYLPWMRPLVYGPSA